MRRRYPTRDVVLRRGYRDLFQADLVDMQAYSRENKGYKYLLTHINVFSKFATAVPLKSKRGDEVAKAYESIIKSKKVAEFLKPGKGSLLHVDRGKEFYCIPFKKMLSKHGIKMYSVYTVHKASVVERFNRTLKERMWREFSAKGSYQWTDMLDQLLDDYNHSVHRTTGRAPDSLTLEDEKFLLDLYNRKHARMERGRVKFKVGDIVRISKIKGVFDKGYLPGWSTELFRVVEVCKTFPVTYKLEDLNGDPIHGGFYSEEIHKTEHPDVYLVEKVIKTKGKRAYVKFLGFPSSENAWINLKDIV